MKIFTANKIQELDKLTIENEPIISVDLMERASNVFYNWIEPYLNNIQPVSVFCGVGNNGGDGLVVARLIALNHDIKVNVYVTRFSEKASNDFLSNFDRLKDIGKINLVDIKPESAFPIFNENEIIIDAIFGSGLSRPVSGFTADLIAHINSFNNKVYSIDVPSGLFCDTSMKGVADDNIIQADKTLSFEFPKIAFMFSENNKYVGDWYCETIGIDKESIDKTKTHYHFLEAKDISKNLKFHNKFSHKGSNGKALLVSGSKGKMGAAVLASKACLRSGLGLLTTHIPSIGNDVLQTSIPEAMASIDDNHDHISQVNGLSDFNAIGIGPGIGIHKDTIEAFKHLLFNYKEPLVIDADGINILAKSPDLLELIPENSILTPHLKEFERITGKCNNDFERLEVQRNFSVKNNVIVILKGAHTSITSPKGNCYFNSTGNPGMATAGSGDVLTGIILGLLAQGYTSLNSAKLGVYLHGLSADIAINSGQSFESLIASDIIECLGDGFNALR